MSIAATQAARAYTGNQAALAPELTEGRQPQIRSSRSAQEAFLGAARDFMETMRQGETVSKATMAGEADAHALVQALAEAELAIETAVTVRDKVVEAYQEILRMPV